MYTPRIGDVVSNYERKETIIRIESIGKRTKYHTVTRDDTHNFFMDSDLCEEAMKDKRIVLLNRA